jgi:predicted MFS family arabinose efflux permease
MSETLFGHDPKEGVPILVSAAGVGAMVASLLVGSLRRSNQILNSYFIFVFGTLISLTFFVLTANFWFAVFCMILLSISQVGVNIAGQVTVQSTVRGDLRGRVMSLWGLLNRSGPAFGALVIGGLSGLWGFAWPILAGVGVSAIVALFVFSKKEDIKSAASEEEQNVASR